MALLSILEKNEKKMSNKDKINLRYKRNSIYNRLYMQDDIITRLVTQYLRRYGGTRGDQHVKSRT